MTATVKPRSKGGNLITGAWTKRKDDCQRESRAVPLDNPVTDLLIRSAGMDPQQFWRAMACGHLDEAVKILSTRCGGDAAVNEELRKRLRHG